MIANEIGESLGGRQREALVLLVRAARRRTSTAPFEAVTRELERGYVEAKLERETTNATATDLDDVPTKRTRPIPP